MIFKRFYFIIIFLVLISNSCKKGEDHTGKGKEIVLRLEPGANNPRNSEGDFIRLKDGRILFVYTHFTDGSGDNSKAFLAGRVSDDNGKTWTQKDDLVLSNEGGMNIMSVSLLRLQDDRIALFYLRKNSETDCIPFMRISTDEAKTWSDPVRCIPEDGYFVVNNDRFLQLPDGRIIFPASRHSAPKWANGELWCYYSDDQGRSWKRSEPIHNPEHIVLQEPGIVALKGDKLMLFCRTDTGVQYFSFSEDQGETWSEIEAGNIRSPLSPASIERIPSTGDLLLVWNNNFEKQRDGGKRTPLNLAVSKNEGKTWEKVKTIESDPSGWYCYTAIDFEKDHVLLGHCAGDAKTNNGLSTMQITRLSLEWIYKDATPDPVLVSDDTLVRLQCADKKAIIRYTLDGSLPAEDKGLIYTKAFKINGPVPLFMQTFQKDKTPSTIIFKNVGTRIFQPAVKFSEPLLPGLKYHFYKGEFDQTDAIDRSEMISTGILPGFTIENSKAEKDFGFIFNGIIQIPKDGRYTFYLRSNDGSVLYLNDFKLIDNDGAHGAYLKSSSISLRKGSHRINVKYFQAGGSKTLRVYWKEPGSEREEIPASVLFHRNS